MIKKAWISLIFIFVLTNVDFLTAGEIMKITENDSGKTVEIKVGDDLEIALPANPTTGYVWEVSALDDTVLKLEKTDYIADDKAIGSGGMEVIKFHALAEGRSEARLIFHRPFERNVPPLKTFSAIVLIKK